ncbi:precorrin-3B synthase [Spongisporangium articulatum]|uniref:Precorrin-3B synthase n=1 Tax=Spongisporangium articulatum TaxID=3362603 RepID=A0ABW8AKE8_9ACTN
MDRLPVARTAPDACPGVLRPFHASDGEIVRVRVPGGLLTVAGLRELSRLSAAHGDGRVGLTSRGNVQLRGLSAGSLTAVEAGCTAAGLLPHPTHELVRNIVASALSGQGAGGLADTDGLAAAVDAAICASARFAQLPGRFLFAVDDGSGDTASVAADVRAVAAGPDEFALFLGGEPGPVVARASVVVLMLAAAEAFLDVRGDAWRVRELPAGALADQDHRLCPVSASETADNRALPVILEPGVVDQADGRVALVAIAPLGLLDAGQVEALAACAELASPEAATVRLTPSRRVVVRDLDLPAALAARELLDAVGLVVRAGTGWDRLTACAGRPGCAKSLADVHADARALVDGLAADGPALHLSGCDRACGAPAGATRLVATGTGYTEVAP